MQKEQGMQYVHVMLWSGPLTCIHEVDGGSEQTSSEHLQVKNVLHVLRILIFIYAFSYHLLKNPAFHLAEIFPLTLTLVALVGLHLTTWNPS